MKICRNRYVLGAAFALVLAALPASRARAADPPVTADDVLHYLNETIDWYRSVTSLSSGPINSEEVIFRDAAQQNAKQVLRLAFDYARAEAALVAPPATTPTADAARSKNMAQSLQAADQRAIEIHAQLDRLAKQIADASADALPLLQARRDKLISELTLVNARRDVLRNYTQFIQSSGGGLLQKIDDLAHSVPDLNSDAPAAASAPATPAKPGVSISPLMPAVPTSAAPESNAPQTFRPESTGVFGLIGDMFSFTQRINETRELASRAAALKQLNDKLRLPMRAELSAAIKQSQNLAQTQESDSVDVLGTQRAQIDSITSRFKQLAGAAVPLGEQGTVIDSSVTNFQEWRSTIERQYGRAIRALVIRVGSIGLAIVIILGLSQLWRRATFRYVKDARRRRQFLLVRRLVVTAIILIVVVLGVVTEFGSLATFAGLITAGIAVALQTVIVSGVAYFFFIGRYGVRVGDRVTISGVTGDVIDIGLFRLYLMELSGSGRDLHPTGRICVFANSVLFQPSAFFKQIPGADYSWHEISLTLSPDSDHGLAENQLLRAVESVYDEYKQTIEQQHTTVTQQMHLQLPVPKPQGRLKLVDAGLEFTVRYPVEFRRATEIDDRITRRLLDTIEHEPKLRLVPSGTPRIQSAEVA